MPSGKTEACANIGVAILAKAPLAGFAKTRLIPRLGAEGAAVLQRWLLQRTVKTALSAGIGPVTLWCAPDTSHPDFTLCHTFGPLTLHRQPDGDLGERMLAAIAGASTPAGTLVIGTDCPALTPALLRQAASALAAHDAAVVPAEDGGYVLIGVRQAASQIFAAVDWSTGRVMAQTRARLLEMGWRWEEFPPLWDVDRGEDLERLNASFPASMEKAEA
jgi:hypothetical protein